jgi:predicted RNase H-like nuclease (RuvC/YqgF family)
LKLKDKVIDDSKEVSMEIEDDSDAFEDLERITKEALEKYQRHTMALKQMLKKKEKEIKILKTGIISQVEEKKKVDDELRKILEEFKEKREIDINLRTQIEEAKRIEELMKNQANEKEESCHKLEAEVLHLKRKSEKSNTHVKFMNNSIILDIQRSPNDKSCLGYNKEAPQYEFGTSKNHDVGPSFSKGEIQAARQAPLESNEIFRR